MRKTSGPAAPRLVSVVIPARNAAATLAEQLDALAAQTYPGEWEVVVADHGSTDGTAEVTRSYEDRLPAIGVVRVQGGTGVARPRNVGVRASMGDLVALCDADDVVAPQWLDALVAVAADADIVGGTFDVTSLNSERSAAWRGMDAHGPRYVPLEFLPYAPGGNCAFWREVFDAVSGWPEDYGAGNEDVDFCWRAQLQGYSLDFAPDAILAYRFRDDLRSLLRQQWHYGRSEALLYVRFRDRGARGPAPREVFWTWRRLARDVRLLRADEISRGTYLRDVAWRAGRLLGGLRRGVLLG